MTRARDLSNLGNTNILSISGSNVGVGTTNPSTKLQVNSTIKIDGTANPYLQLSDNASNSGYLQIASGLLDLYHNGSVSFSPGGSEKVRITSSGNVGIGITNPTTTLQVQGNTTALDTRFQSVGEKTTRISGNTASLVYNTGGGNIAICTNPTGDITLAVTGIPTDTSFNDTSITFSVFVNQTGTARSCTAVTLNGSSATIRWAGGSLSSAISGVTTTSGMDIYSFTGINTVGSASTTTNYYVMGVVNGGFA